MFKKYRSNKVQLLTETNEVEINGRIVKLTPKEIGVLELLMDRSNTTVSRTELLEKVWDYKFGNDQGLTQSISKLRGVLADNPNVSIRTIPKRGYLYEEHTFNVNRPSYKSIGLNFNTFLIGLLLLVICALIFIQRIEIRIDEIDRDQQQSENTR